jgi:tetratricopeptide (TPR) repeat protein
MRKLIVLIAVIFVFNNFLFAGPWRSYKAFQEYLSVKNKAKQADADGDTYTAVTNYLKAAEIASKSADANVLAWQLNNAAYSLIIQFKKLVDYDKKLQKLTEMKPGKEKIAYQKEFAEMLNLQFSLLEEALGILKKTKDLGEELEAKEKIKSNLDFINWVKEFIATNLNEKTESEETEKDENK